MYQRLLMRYELQAVEMAYLRKFNLWMIVLRVHGVKFEREKYKCSLVIKYWFLQDRVCIRCSPFHCTHQSNNKEAITLEEEVSVRSLITEDKEIILRRNMSGTERRELDWEIAEKMTNRNAMFFSYCLRFMAKIIYTVLFTD